MESWAHLQMGTWVQHWWCSLPYDDIQPGRFVNTKKKLSETLDMAYQQIKIEAVKM